VDQRLYLEGDSGKNGLNSTIIRLIIDSHPSYLFLKAGKYLSSSTLKKIFVETIIVTWLVHRSIILDGF